MPTIRQKKLDNQEKNKPLRNEKGQLLPGQTANPNGRPKGKTLKEYQAEKFRTMNDEEKEEWLKTHKVSGETQWKMAEGNPENKTDLTTLGQAINPIDPTDPIILENLKAIQEKLENDKS